MSAAGEGGTAAGPKGASAGATPDTHGAKPTSGTPKTHPDARLPGRRPRGGFWRFVRSVFSHAFFAAVVVAGVLGYLYQGEILRKVGDTVCSQEVLGRYMSKSHPLTSMATGGAGGAGVAAPKGSDAAGSTVVVKSTSLAPTAPTENQTASVAKTDALKTDAANSAPTTDGGATAAPADDATGEIDEAGSVSPTVGSTPEQQPEVRKPAKADLGSGAGPEMETRKSAAGKPPETPAPATGAASASPPAPPRPPLREAWEAARQAYNFGDPGAVAAYKALLADYPDVAGLAGELGNIYYTSGKYDLAAEQYYSAALRHLAGPRPGIATCLMGVLEQIGPQKAEALRARLTAPCPKS